VIAAGLLCFSPLVARADAASDARFAAMEQRMSQLEDKLAASEQVVADQAELLKTQATPAVGAGEGSQIDAFLNTVTVGGYVSASFVYNNNNPDNPIYAQAVNQFDLDHNTFTLDGAKLEFGRAAAAPGEAGFQLDLMFGDDGGILGAYRFNTPGYASDNFVYVQEMYASYNWNDVVFKFGKWETLLGSEVIDPILNRNVTQGLLFTYAIPLVHTGLMASGKLTEEIGWALAAANGWNNATDTNDNKGVLGQLTYSSGPFTTGLSTYYGSDGYTGFADPANNTVENSNESRALVLDWTATVLATDALTFWWNVDWGMQDDVVFTTGPQAPGTDNAQWYGVAVGTQYAFNEKTTLAVRGEWFRDSDGYRMFLGENTDAYSLTGTLGYKLTPNLLTRLEVRMDEFNTDDSTDDVFPQGGGSADGDLYGIVNVSYIFD
jgi:hypothetical protein